MSTELPDDGNNTFMERASEPPEEVVMSRPLVETRGLQPEDVGSLACLLLLPEGVLATPKELAAYMRGLGWKMSDERFSTISKRLEKAGHIERRNVYNPDTKRPEKRLRVYRNPANNPAYVSRGVEESLQVGADNRETRFPEGSEDRKTRFSPGQSREPQKAVPGPTAAKDGFRNGDVPAGQSREPQKAVPGPPPPHPPEVVVTTSPYPLTDGARSHPSQTEEGEGAFTADEIQAAEDFLLKLPKPWTVGGATARRLSTDLLETMRGMRWPGIGEVDLSLLSQNLLTDPPKQFRAASILPIRIGDLPLYEAVAPKQTDQSARRRFNGSGL
ncbi:hypothetical protein ACGFNY_45450 [Streptomyces chartreusis]|uniref:hypothetical protein n=1 Tax=Streptomyces chartreusis TaxID=1969 RepID=UPI00371BAE8D